MKQVILTLGMVVLLASCGGGGGGNNFSQFSVYNNCPYTIWLQSDNQPSQDPSIVKLNSIESYSYHINGQSVPAFRVWPKVGCDSSGNNCEIGQERPPCPNGGCQPGGVDSVFEGTFNAPAENGATTVDGSLVNGFTLPFTIKMIKSSDETNPSCMDAEARTINYNDCPTESSLATADHMSFLNSYTFGPFSDLTNISLKVKNPNYNNKVIGCASPSTQLTNPTGWGGLAIGANDSGFGVSFYDEVIMYSCPFTTAQLYEYAYNNKLPTGFPTQPLQHGFQNLSEFCKGPSGGCPTPAQVQENPQLLLNSAASNICKSGPVKHTQYVTYVHSNTHHVYAYAYDDGIGSLVCNSPKTKIIFTLCP